MSLMKKALFVASALAVALPLASAFAQSDDATYCQALAQQVRTVNRGADPSSAVGGALAFMGVAIGWWLMYFSAPLLLIGIWGWVFEYYRGENRTQ